MALQARVVNDGNRLLTVEGEADLPHGSPLEAVLTGTEDRVVARGQGMVRGGVWYLTMDIAQAPGNTPMELAVTFDPTKAPSGVRREVGDEGERMVGDGVEREGSHSIVVERLRVILPMSRRDAGIREVMSGDFATGIAALEPVLERHPDDAEAGAWLALAQLQRLPAERRPQSRSHKLLLRAQKAGLGEPLRSQVTEWLGRLQREASMDDRRRERDDARQAATDLKERRAKLVEPGKALAGIDLGMDAGTLFGDHTPAQFPTWGQGPVVVTFPKLPGVEVELDGVTRRVTRVTSTSPEHRLEGDLGVGSPYLAFQGRYPALVAGFGELQAGEDGVRRTRGEARTDDGLVIVVERVLDELGLPMDSVVGVGVVAPVRATPPP